MLQPPVSLGCKDDDNFCDPPDKQNRLAKTPGGLVYCELDASRLFSGPLRYPLRVFGNPLFGRDIGFCPLLNGQHYLTNFVF